MLPICLGEATKLSAYLLDGDKRYQVTCRLGIATDSADADGNVIAETAIPEFDQTQLHTAIEQQVGQQQQIPPMYSALKVDGQPLYKLARQGIEIERRARTVTIHQITLLDWSEAEFTLDVTCSKGTYIRTLVEQVAQNLGTIGHVTMLRRTASAGYDIAQAITIDKLLAIAEQAPSQLDNCLLPSEGALPDWPAIHVDEQQTFALRQGQQIQVDQPFEAQQIRLFDHNDQFIGLGEMTETAIVSPKRVFVLPEQDN